MKQQSICVVGMWHLGCVLSVCLAEAGYQVIGVDDSQERIRNLARGVPPIYEPGVAELLKKHTTSGGLKFSSDLRQTLLHCSVVWIAHDMAVDDKDNVDLTELRKTTRTLASGLTNNSLLIVSSQVPISTCEWIENEIRREHPSLTFEFVYTPENLRLGNAIECFRHPKRIVIGANQPSAFARFDQLTSFLGAERIRVSVRSAEMAKHALNAFLATSVSFVNEIAKLCDQLGADVTEVVRALKSDERIGANAFLNPGLGFSGGTLARDLKVLEKKAGETKTLLPVISGAIRTNELIKELVIQKLRQVYPRLKGRTIGVLGLTYKPGTSTIRRSVALEVIKKLKGNGVVIKTYDPMADLKELNGGARINFEHCQDALTAARDADALVLMTEWPEFRSLDFKIIGKAMRNPVLFDSRNFLDREHLQQLGFQYIGIGRGNFEKGDRLSYVAQR